MGTSSPSDDPAPGRALLERLAEGAEADGFIPFDRYMETVLYAEPGGYYARPRSPLGPPGDFYTAPHVTSLFAETFAARVLAIRARLGIGRRFQLVELGPGDGTLIEGILEALPRASPDVEGLEVVLVERSSSLRARSLARARVAAERRGVDVRATESLGAGGPFEGVVVANELLDAQPVRRFRREGPRWLELGVRVHDGRVGPAETTVTNPIPGPPLPSTAPDGTVLELSPKAEALVREVADHLVHGVLIVDDFGMEERELVAGHPHGTLEAVRGHRAGRDPLEAPGSADLSAFVNWTRLRAVASVAGLAVLSDRSQAEALGEWGFPRLLDAAKKAAPNPEAAVRLQLAVKSLLFGFERFRILEFVPSRDRTSWSEPR